MNIKLKIVTKITPLWKTALNAIWTSPGKLFGLDFEVILGSILEPRARHAIFVKNGTALQREHDF